MNECIVTKGSSLLQRMAAKELRRYLYVMEGIWPEIVPLRPETGDAMILAGMGQVPEEYQAELFSGCRDGGYCIKSFSEKGKNTIVLTGETDLSVLYAVYDFLETRGIRFYLHGDVLPEKKPRESAFRAKIRKKEKPLFTVRGILPFHDFPEGPDWWSRDEYLSAVTQLVKMRANFIGLHTYPEMTGGENNLTAEPLVWIGKKGDCDEKGNVKTSYPVQHFKTNGGSWGYHAMLTGDYPFDMGQVFEKDAYCSEYMDTYANENYWEDLQNDTDPGKYNALFNEYGDWLGDIFRYANSLGVKTCVGTETPLTVPKSLKRNGADTVEFYEGMFERIRRKYPLDYYWMWTPEDWTWRGNTREETEKTVADIRCALKAAERTDAPFQLALCGWTLGPQEDRALFHNCFPKEMPFSCINRNVGFEPLEPKFSEIRERPAWAIPWLEDDPAMTSVQLWAGRVRKDAYDACRYGCVGLIGIHWRTRSTAPTMKAMMEAAWRQEGWQDQVIESDTPEGFCGKESSILRWPGEEGIFATAREGMESYHLSVPSGVYTVSFYMKAPYAEKDGGRVFDIHLNGKKITGIDLSAGHKEGHVMKADNVSVGQDRGMDIQFLPSAGKAIVSGICVEGMTNNNQLAGDYYCRKIDCGGAGGGGFEADLPMFEGDGRYAGTEDFYDVWAGAEFGQKAGPGAAEIFRRLDCHMPRPTRWLDGPGNIFCNPIPWKEEEGLYRFVDEFYALEPLVSGAECRERFLYWYHTFSVIRLSGKTGCLWGAIRKASENHERAAVNSIYRELAETICRLEEALLMSLETSGEMGVLANLQQRSIVPILRECGKIMEEMKLEIPPFPEPETEPCMRMAIPCVRTDIREGEDLRLKVIVIGGAEQAELYYRKIGENNYQRVDFVQLRGWVYEAVLPAEKIPEDFEYHITAKTGERRVRFPAGETERDQSVIVLS